MYTTCRFTKKRLLKPGLKLIGAKTSSRDLLYQLMEPHDVYIEPFAGSTTVLTGKAPSPIEIIGDTNEYLRDYVRTLQKMPEEFWSQFEYHLPLLVEGKKERFLYCREWVTKNIPSYERAIFFYLISKACFNGIFRLGATGACSSSYCGQTHARGWFSREWFDKVVERYSSVQFVHGDYRETIRQGANIPRTKQLFLDPPYRFRASGNGAGTVTTYNGQKFLDKDFEELKEQLDVFSGKFLMTINDDEWTRRLFSNYEIVPHQINYSASQTPAGRGLHGELLIANYEITSRFKELKSSLQDAKKETKSGAVG